MALDMVALAREPDFRLGRCVVSPSAGLLTAPGGGQARLEPRVMQVLVALARRAGHPVAREDLLHACWGNVVVGDDALNRCIQRLRAAFRDLAEPGIQIETLPRLGYRLRLPDGLVVEPLQPPPAAPPAPAPSPPEPPAPAPPPARRPWLPLALAGGAAVLGGLVVLAAMLLWGDAGPGWEVRRVGPATARPGRETWPALSPDGGQLAFAARLADPGNADIYLQSAAGGTPVRLTDDAGMDLAPAWSPDGSRIAFSRSADGQPCRLLVMTVPAGQPQQVGQCRDAPWTQPAWAPDGKSLVFPDRPGIMAPFQIYRLSLEDGRVTPLTRALARTWGHDRPTVSPDGRRVAFVDTPAWSVQDVQVLDLLDGTVRRVTNEGGEIGGLAWLRDGSLVFSSARQGDRGLWTLAPGAEAPRRLLAGVQDLRRLSAARHADRLAVESWTFHANLFELSLDPGGSPAADTSGKRLTFATAADHDPDLAPDGSLAFISTRSGTPEIWVKPAGGEPRRLTELGGTSISSVRWSPDGTRLAFAAARAGNYDVFTVRADGSGLKRWTEEMEEDLSPVWAADGRSLYFTSRRTGFWRLWSLDLETGDAQPLTGDGPMTVRASPDGQAIYYAKEGESGIWRRTLDGSGEEALVVSGFGYQDWPNWTIADGRLWYVLRGQPGGTVLVRAGLDGQGAEPVATLSRFYAMSGLAVRPDGRSVVLSNMVIDEADIHLVDLARHD